MLFQSNLEYFTFLGFRSFDLMFSFNSSTTMMKVFSILFMFILILVTICSYLGYYYQYGKLARYFLNNMYRFKSSYVLMTIVFGIKPFFKGFVHAMFFENWLLQIWLLIGIESLVIVVVILFEIILDNHKSRVKLFF